MPSVDFSQKLPNDLEQILLKTSPGTYYLEVQKDLVKVFYVLELPSSPTSTTQKVLRQTAFRRLSLFDWEVVWPNQKRVPTAFPSWESCLEAEGRNLLKVPLHRYLQQQSNRSQLINPRHFAPSTSLAYQYLTDPRTSSGSYLFTQNVLNKNVFYLMFVLVSQYNQKTYRAKIEFAENGYLILKDNRDAVVETFASFEHLLTYSKQKFHLNSPSDLLPLSTFNVDSPLPITHT